MSAAPLYLFSSRSCRSIQWDLLLLYRTPLAPSVSPPPLPGSSFRLTLSDDVFAFVASLALLALRCVLAFVGWMVGGSIGYVACLLALPL